MDDPKFDGIRDDVRHLGTWTLLLIVADMAWPAPAFLPPVPKASVVALEAAGIVDLLAGHRFRIHGLDAERGRRSDAARDAASVRWQSTRSADAMQTHSGRNAEPMLDETRRDKTSNTRAHTREEPWKSELRSKIAEANGGFDQPRQATADGLLSAQSPGVNRAEGENER
jgi:hypothetical protein